MPRPSGKKVRRASNKKKKRTSQSDSAQVGVPIDPLRTGMPALDSITGVKEIIRKGKVIRIIKTTEMDSYDEPLPKKRRKTKSPKSS